MSDEIFCGARQAGNLIGRAFGDSDSFMASMERTKRLTVLPEEPTEEDIEQFEVLVKTHTIHVSEYGLMIRVDQNISTGINLRSGYYALGTERLTGGLLYLARRFGGWEDPTGATLKEQEKGQP